MIASPNSDFGAHTSRSRSSGAVRLAWGLVAASVVLAGVAVIFTVLMLRHLRHAGAAIPFELVYTLELVPGMAFCFVGGLIGTRRSDNRIGWLCLAIGLLLVVLAATNVVGLWALRTGMMPRSVGEWLYWPPSLWVPPVGIMGTHLLFRLPDGELPSSRWRLYSRICTAVIVFASLILGAEPYAITGVPGNVNPTAVESLVPLMPLAYALLALTFVGGPVSVVMRYRRAGAVERLQLRWIASAAAFSASVFAPALVVVPWGNPLGAHLALAAFSFLVAFTAIPVAIGVAVLRYRLYEIDRVVSRTVTYAVLTVLLGGAYVAVVAVLRQLLSPVTGESRLAVAGSTLAVAALFMPVRRRVQRMVDRRFNRARYDAARTVEEFAARLRDQVDLDEVTAELLAAVHATVQPARVSLWLRESGATVTISGRL